MSRPIESVTVKSRIRNRTIKVARFQSGKATCVRLRFTDPDGFTFERVITAGDWNSLRKLRAIPCA